MEKANSKKGIIFDVVIIFSRQSNISNGSGEGSQVIKNRYITARNTLVRNGIFNW